MPLTIGFAYLSSVTWTAHVLKSGRFSFLTVATNATKNMELTQVQDKNCIGTLIIL